jgi:hypothetical protein
MPEQNNGSTRQATDQPAQDNAEKNPQQPKSQRIDLTPPEPMNLGYVGGVHVPKTKA